MRRVLLAVDLSYQTYRAAASHPKLSNADGLFTGGLYGFLVTLAKTIRDVEATHVVVTEDSKPYRRSEFYPAYKQLRKESGDPELKEKFEVSKPMVREALSTIGIPSIAVPGYESDDIIGHLAVRERHRFDLIYAASNDSDLFALLRYPTFRVYRKDETDIVSAESLLRDTGLTPEQHSLATALMGTHNDVEGIKGVGVKTAQKAVKDPAILRGYRERYGPMIDRNLKLIQLPYDGFPSDVSLPKPTRSFSHRELYKWFARYDIAATKSMLDSFERICP